MWRQLPVECAAPTLPEDYLCQWDRSTKRFSLLAPHGTNVDLRAHSPSLALPR